MSEGSLANLLRERAAQIVDAWTARFERSPLRFRRATAAAAHTAPVANLVETLAVALVGADLSQLERGGQSARELERTAAFLGAQFASEGATGFDVSALLLELRDAIVAVVELEPIALTHLFEWLTVVALDTFAASGLQSLRERQSEQLETGTPIVEILPKVPAVLLVGAPSAQVVDSLLARAFLLAVGTSAPCLIIDGSGLAEPGERAFDAGYQAFLDQASGSNLQVLLTGARRGLRERAAATTTERGLAYQHFDRLDSAVAHAAERAGYLIRMRQA